MMMPEKRLNGAQTMLTVFFNVTVLCVHVVKLKK
jgi:hypothetical protein